MADRPVVYGLSLFTGGGGLELGVERGLGCELRPLLYVEREAFAAAYLGAAMESGWLASAPVWSDVTTIPEGVLGELRRVGERHPLVLTAGFPCQPFSAAGKRRGVEDERWMWDDIARVIRLVRPGLIVLENVPGIALHGLDAVAGTLAEAGYSAGWDVFRASEAGAPHQRARWFCVAHRDGVQWRPAHGRSDTRADGRDDSRHMGGELGDSERGERGGVEQRSREERGRWQPGPADGREGVADARNGQLLPAKRGAVGGEGTPGAGGRVADSPGLDGGQAERGEAEGELRRPCGEGMADSNRSRERFEDDDSREPHDQGRRGGVADADVSRLPRREGIRGAVAGECRGFPPGPVADWSRIPRHLWPALTAEEEAELAVRLLADGLESRIDLLRLAGNGVVPQQAELAVRMLLRQLRGEP